MKFSLLISSIFPCVIAECNAQTIAKNWYGKWKEELIISKDSTDAYFKAGGLSRERYDVKVDSNHLFWLGRVEWKHVPVKSNTGNEGFFTQRDEKLVDWFPFKINKLSEDTLVLACVWGRQCISKDVRSFTFYSRKRITEIKNPVFINLQYDWGGYHVSIDSSGVATYWFDDANLPKISPGQKISGRLSVSQMNQLRYWFRSDEVQELSGDIGSAADGNNQLLIIQCLPKDIIAYGSGHFPDEIQFGLVKFLKNIGTEMKKSN